MIVLLCCVLTPSGAHQVLTWFRDDIGVLVPGDTPHVGMIIMQS